MKALFLVADGFEDLELFYPLYRLREAGIDVVIAAKKADVLTGKHGYTKKIDATFDAVDMKDFSILVIPGGKSPESVRLDPKALDISRHFFKKSLPVAAICHGIQVLISAGVLKGRKATCYAGVKDDLILAGASYSDQQVVVDKNLVTSRVPSDLPAFMGELMRLVKS